MNKVIIIENLPIGKGSPEITDLLAPLGTVNWVYLQGDESAKSRSAVVEMGSEKEAVQVIVKWNGAEWEEKILRVKYIDATFNPK